MYSIINYASIFIDKTTCKGDFMRYKMIAMDMDGTLLTTDKMVSEYSKDVLQRAADMGVKLVVCTGRIFKSAKIFAKIIGTKAPVVASNGAYIREKDKDEVIYSKPLNRDEIYKVIDISKKYDFCPQVFTSDTIFSEKLIHSAKNYLRWNETLLEKDRINIHITDDIYSIIDENLGSILKVLVMSDEDDKLLSFRKDLKSYGNFSIVSSFKNNAEIMSEGISKGNAVKILADYFNISKDEVVCFGDGENDASMIKYAGLGIAMDNAIDEIKEIADYITDTNDNDGVAKAIEKFVLKEA